MTDLSGVLDEDGLIRLSLVRASTALVDLLGGTPDPVRLRELGGLMHDLGDVCIERALSLDCATPDSGSSD